MRPKKEVLNFEKFKRAIHYVIWKAGNRANFGATKLNKVLWFTDAGMYVLHQHSMTGATYVREKHGPVPKPFVPAREALKKAGTIEVWKDGKLTRFRTKSNPDMTEFSSEEMRLLDHWIEVIDKEHTAESISEKTHDYGWEIAIEGEEIPLIAILAERVRQPNEEEIAWAHDRMKKRGLG